MISTGVKEICICAFCNCKKLKHVAFAKGNQLEIIGKRCFSESGVTEISIPSSVTTIEDNAFNFCRELTRVAFAEDSRLEKIGSRCFCGSGIKAITLPRMLKEIGDSAFQYSSPKTIYVEEGCEASLKDARVSDWTRIIPISTTLIGGADI